MSPSRRADDVELTADMLGAWPLPNNPDGDKHDRGTVLVIAGSTTTPGAALLAGTAALRAGAGRLQIATHANVAMHVAVAVPEAMVIGTDSGRLDDAIADADSIVIGPGVDRSQPVADLLAQVLELARRDTVIVVDAAALDELTCAAATARAGRLVLTPNRSELARLADRCGADGGDDMERVAVDYAAVVTSFGTVWASDGRRWHTDVGHPGLGTSGSGDVLAGLVGGLAARCHDAAQASCWGTLVHLLAGEHLGSRCDPLGFLARDLVPAAAAALDATERRRWDIGNTAAGRSELWTG